MMEEIRKKSEHESACQRMRSTISNIVFGNKMMDLTLQKKIMCCCTQIWTMMKYSYKTRTMSVEGEKKIYAFKVYSNSLSKTFGIIFKNFQLSIQKF